MEEKILVKSERYKTSRILIAFIVLSVSYSFISFAVIMNDLMSYCQATNQLEYMSTIDTAWEYGLYYTFNSMYPGRMYSILIPTALIIVLGVLVFLWLRSYELTVTDKRVYGKVAFGKRVDLPVDSVSATATISLFKGVSVSTSSGKISFLVIKNTDEIYEVINNLLIERQKNKPETNTTTIVQNSDEADMLKKYKDLLDSGVITQEEFDAKKKQLLGL